MNGFVYLWFDRKRKMFYLGSHYGSPDDRYICGSKRMLCAYRARPDTFKRRIVEKVVGDRAAVKAAEQRWLDRIKPAEFGGRYYNLSAKAHGADPVLASKWMLGNKNGYGKPCSPEKRKKIGDAQKGKIVSIEARLKMSAAKKGKRLHPDVYRRNAEKLRGRKHTEEAKAKMKAAKLAGHARRREMYGTGHSPETIAKISATKKAQYAARVAAP